MFRFDDIDYKSDIIEFDDKKNPDNYIKYNNADSLYLICIDSYNNNYDEKTFIHDTSNTYYIILYGNIIGVAKVNTTKKYYNVIDWNCCILIFEYQWRVFNSLLTQKNSIFNNYENIFIDNNKIYKICTDFEICKISFDKLLKTNLCKNIVIKTY